MKPNLALLVVLVLGPAAAAQNTTVVPNAYASTLSGGTGLNTYIRDAGNPRTGQLLISQTQLTAIPTGSQITGLSFRLASANTTGFPATAATWSDYTINVGPGVAMGTQTTTFASNFAAAPTTVRTGPLTVPAGAYTGGSSPAPNPFGPAIGFTTPYTYTGGNLLIEIRHTGSDITNSANDFLEAVQFTEAGYAAGNYWSATGTGHDALTGGMASFTVTQLQFTPVPEPGTIGLIGAAVLGVGAWGRRQLRAVSSAPDSAAV